MFKDNFAVSLKVGGKFLRERNSEFNIPFGEEYSIYLKNLNTRRSVVKISVDGEDVLRGNRIVIEPNSALDLEGFMDGTSAKNKFKFIKRIKEIEEHRGTNIDDGLIRIEFQFEKPQPVYSYIYTPYWPWPDYYVYPKKYSRWDNNVTWTYTSYSGDVLSSGGRGSSNTMSSNFLNSSPNMEEPVLTSSFTDGLPHSDAGITVEGSDINQKFYPTYVGNLEDESYVIVLKLTGYDGKVENKPIFTTDKVECKTCGLKNRNTDKFCSRCGTRLV